MRYEKEINALRMMALEMINMAGSGHPGAAISQAPAMFALFTNHLQVSPENPEWINRDRFVLSSGHASALYYAMLHLAGFKVLVSDLELFRQKDSITPGHPEYGVTEGVDASTGPLGQGISNAVGMAIAEQHLATLYNRSDFKVFDHYTYAIVSDGDLQEGISFESMAVAGNLQLNKLIVLHDSNNIQLDGPLSDTSSFNVEGYVKALNWNYIRINSNDAVKIAIAIQEAKKEPKRPTLIEIKTIIGEGLRDQNTSKVHGSPISSEEMIEMRQKNEWTTSFSAPSEINEFFREKITLRGNEAYKRWKTMFQEYKNEFHNLYTTIQNIIQKRVSVSININLISKNEATRITSSEIFTIYQKEIPNILVGSADLSSSTKIKGIHGQFTKDNRIGNNINYGVREHAMAAITNGIQLHGATFAVASTFLVFSDYMKPALRLAAIQKIAPIFVFSHDSIFVGEDGPTHQPVEHLAMLRSIPNMIVIRPSDEKEVAGAWRVAFASKTSPTAIITTRQKVSTSEGTDETQVLKGGYVTSFGSGDKRRPDFIFVATGSELTLAEFAASRIERSLNVSIRVVSMPSIELFKKQLDFYKDSILLPNIPKLFIEAGVANSWIGLANDSDAIISIEKFGLSSPGSELYMDYGFNYDNIFTIVKRQLIKNGSVQASEQELADLEISR